MSVARATSASPADVPGVAALATASLPGAFSEDAFRDELDRADGRLWVVRRDGRVVGYLAARLLDDTLEVLSVAVAETCRRQGLGHALFDLAFRTTPRLARAALELRAEDSGARAFYERLGFVAVGRRPRYYRDGGDAILMTRDRQKVPGP